MWKKELWRVQIFCLHLKIFPIVHDGTVYSADRRWHLGKHIPLYHFGWYIPCQKACANPITVIRIFLHWPIGFTLKYLIVKKITLHNENSPIMDPIHCVLRALKTSRSSSSRQTYVFQSKIAQGIQKSVQNNQLLSLPSNVFFKKLFSAPKIIKKCFTSNYSPIIENPWSII